MMEVGILLENRYDVCGVKCERQRHSHIPERDRYPALFCHSGEFSGARAFARRQQKSAKAGCVYIVNDICVGCVDVWLTLKSTLNTFRRMCDTWCVCGYVHRFHMRARARWRRHPRVCVCVSWPDMAHNKRASHLDVWFRLTGFSRCVGDR